jgi:hypothetical protein
MVVRRELGDVEGVGGFAAPFAQDKSIPGMEWNPALQVRQSEGSHSITAVGGAENGKERLILVDRQQLAIAEGPALRREIPADEFDFSQERL